MTTDPRIRLIRLPTEERELFQRLLGLYLPIRSYLLISTYVPRRSGDEQTYLVHNDDIWKALTARGPILDAERFRQDFPVGQVTRIPVDCCEIVPT